MASKIWPSIQQKNRLYASSANMDTVLIFDLNGKRIGTLAAKPGERLDGPSALALTQRKAVHSKHGRESRNRH